MLTAKICPLLQIHIENIRESEQVLATYLIAAFVTRMFVWR